MDDEDDDATMEPLATYPVTIIVESTEKVPAPIVDEDDYFKQQHKRLAAAEQRATILTDALDAIEGIAHPPGCTEQGIHDIWTIARAALSALLPPPVVSKPTNDTPARDDEKETGN